MAEGMGIIEALRLGDKLLEIRDTMRALYGPLHWAEIVDEFAPEIEKAAAVLGMESFLDVGNEIAKQMADDGKNPLTLIGICVELVCREQTCSPGECQEGRGVEVGLHTNQKMGFGDVQAASAPPAENCAAFEGKC